MSAAPALRRWLVRHPYRSALALALLLGAAGIFQRSLWTPDEPREAEIAREMLLSGWSALPTLGGAPFLEKPPLHPWIQVLCYRVFGVGEGVARLPAALFSVGSVLLAAAMARRAAGRHAALLAAVALATMLGFVDLSHKAVNDALLACFVAAGHLCFLAARDDERAGRRSAALPLAGLCTGLAFLTKGPIGPILLAGPPLVALGALREWRTLRALAPRAALWCTLGLLALGLPWVLALGLGHGWDKVQVCLVQNTIGRGLGVEAGNPISFGHARGPLYYLGAFPLMAAPWILALPALATGGTLRRGRARFLALLVLAGVLLLSLPSGKRELYLLPLLPAAAAVTGVWLARGGERRTLAAIALLFALVSAALAWFALGAPAGEAARALRESLGPRVAALGPPFVFAALAFGVIALGRRPARVPALAAALAAFVFVLQLALLPLLEPLKSMRAGARELDFAVPANEELLGHELDETTQAVVPFYGGRLLRDLRPAGEALRALEQGRSRHLVLMRKRHLRPPPELAARLVLETTVELGTSRTLDVYRLRDER